MLAEQPQPGSRFTISPSDVDVLFCDIRARTHWAHIVSYLHSVLGHRPHSNEAAERRDARTLLDSDTEMLCKLVVLRHATGGAPYTVRSLSKALAGSSESSQKSMQAKIRTILARVGDHYGLLRHEAVLHEVTRQPCRSIYPTEELIQYFNDMMFPMMKEFYRGIDCQTRASEVEHA